MRIGMAGPISPLDLTPFLDADSKDRATAGLGGTPVTLLTAELLRRGCHVTVFTLDRTVREEVVLQGPRLRICIGQYRERPRERALDFFAMERRYLEQAMRREAPDIIHAQWTYEFALAAQASGIPTLVTAHDAPINVLKAGFDTYRLIRTMMAYWALRQCRHLAVVSPYVERQLRRWHLYSRRMAIIPNGLPTSSFEGYADVAARRAARSQAGKVFATILNGWSGRKNGQAALRAFGLIRAKLPTARLLMIGIGHEPGGPADTWATRQGLADRVEFAGEISHAMVTRRLVDDVDVLLHPALEESHGMVLIEAMALGIPVVGGRSAGAVPWTLEDGQAGALTEVDDAASFAQEACRLSEAAIAEIVGLAGRESVLRRFRIGDAADRYLMLYHDIFSDSLHASAPCAQ